MARDPRRCRDVAVIGAGPAGAAAARMLAGWGIDVVVAVRPADPHRDLAVSLPPSIRKLFGEIGVQQAVDDAGFIRSTGNTVWWGGGEPRTAAFAGGETGYQVRHRDLDRLLSESAAAAGAELMSETTVRAVDFHAEGVALHCETRGGATEVRARLVLDASGRQGVVARQLGLRRRQEEGRTIALIGAWRRPGGWNVPDDSQTLVESFADGWAWSVPVAPQHRYVTCMLDPQVSDLAEGSTRRRYAAALERAPAFRRLLEGAVPAGEPWATDASWYCAERTGGDRFLLIGDAASFVDPLSSYGVKKALASAWLAAVVVNTWRQDRALYSAAVDLFEAQEHRAFEAFRAQAASFFDAVGADREHAFWTGRAAGVAEVGDPDIAALRRDPDVLAAFAALKASPALSLRREEKVEIVEAPAIGDARIVLQQRLVTAALPAGIRFLRGVDAFRLAALAPAHSQVPDLFEAYNRVCAPVPLPDFVGALSVLLAKGVLRNEAVC